MLQHYCVVLSRTMFMTALLPEQSTSLRGMTQRRCAASLHEGVYLLYAAHVRCNSHWNYQRICSQGSALIKRLQIQRILVQTASAPRLPEPRPQHSLPPTQAAPTRCQPKAHAATSQAVASSLSASSATAYALASSAPRTGCRKRTTAPPFRR